MSCLSAQNLHGLFGWSLQDWEKDYVGLIQSPVPQMAIMENMLIVLKPL